MKLTCKKCGAVLTIDARVTQQPEPKVTCTGCGKTYRLKKGSGSGSRTPSAPSTQSVPPLSGISRPPTTPSAATPSTTPRPATSQPAAPQSAAPQPAAPSPPAPMPGPTQRLSGTGQGSVTPASTPGSDASVLRTTPGGLHGAHVFEPGEKVAGRYRIERFLAQGGMGEVYEAEDLELRQRVALKTISSGGFGTAEIASLERFKREIALARTVTHPNVCRIFDLGQHQPAPDPVVGRSVAPISFLTMELLEGETLADFLKRRGRIAPAEALPIVQQMASALDAAHRAQIIHRDFKSENVFLVPEEDGTFRAVVTDFGVARGAEGDSFATQVTGAGIVGTPAYMAPEQVAGEAVTSGADLYALGIVIYEMVTGELPWSGPNPLTTAIKRLQEAPPPPHVHAPDIPGWWERAILRCLERRPEDRFASAGDVAKALAPPAPRPTPARTAPPRVAPATEPLATLSQADPTVGRTRRLSVLLAAVVLISLGLMLFNALRGDRPREVVPRRTVAVLGFEDLAERQESAWIATALGELMRTELGRGEGLRVVPGNTVSRIQTEFGDQLDQLDAEGAARLRQLLASDFAVLGSFLSLPSGELRVDLRLEDLALGQTVVQLSENGDETMLFNMAGTLGQGVRDALGVGATGDDPMAALPQDTEAARLYSEALDELRASHPREAREKLQRAAAREADNPLIHVALSSAWEAEGFHGQAVEAAHRAFEFSSQLPQEDRLVVEGRLREAEGDWQAAAEIYSKLWDLFPDDLEYGLRLAAAETAARKPDGALDAIATLRYLPAPLSEDPRIDLAEAEAAGLAGDLEGQLAAAQRGVERARGLGAALLEARAKIAASQALRFLGRGTEAEVEAGDALRLYSNLDNPAGTALARTALANTLVDRGEFDTASEHYRKAIEGLRKLGDQAGTVSALNNLAVVKKRQGELERARQLYQETLDIYKRLGDTQGTANANNNLGVLLVEWDRLDAARQRLTDALRVWETSGDRSGIAFGLANAGALQRLLGDLRESRRLHERALEMRRQLGHKPGEAASLADLGLVLIDLGDLATAESLLNQSMEICRDLGDRFLLAHALTGLGELRRRQGRLDEAQAAHEEALGLRRELSLDLREAESLLALSGLALDAGKAGRAVERAQEGIALVRLRQRPCDNALGMALLARAWAEEGQHSQEAGTTIEEGLETARECQRLEPAVRVTLAHALLRADTLSTEENLQRLERLERELGDQGYLGLRLETSITWARLAHRAGHQQAAQDRLERLTVEAAQTGHELLIEQAESALR